MKHLGQYRGAACEPLENVTFKRNDRFRANRIFEFELLQNFVSYLPIFSGIVQNYALYENLAWQSQHVAPFLGNAPPL